MLNVVEKSVRAKPSALNSDVQLVTPQMARQLRDEAHFERQRNISQANVERLAAEMKAGRFTPGTQIYICVLPDGSERVVNGNHTLEAVFDCGVPQFLTITRKAVADLDEAGRIYAVFDIQKVRSWRDSLRATGRGDDMPMAEKILSAVGVIESRFSHDILGISSRIERIAHMEEYREAAGNVAAAFQGQGGETRRLLTRAAVMAIALETMRYQPSLAAEFWYRIAHDDGLTSGMPEKALLSWLRNTRNTSGHGSRREHVRAAALAWNAAFRGEQRQYIKPNQMGAFFLLGTPWADGLGE